MAETRGISVVVSTYSMEKKDYVLECINSLHDQSLLPNEILLVLDHNPKLVDFFKSAIPDNVEIIVSDGYGLSNARNTGVKNAKSEIVAFIDDDAVADRDWLRNMYKNYSDPLVVGVGGLVVPSWMNKGKRLRGKTSEWFPEELNWIIGCSYKGQSVRREAVRNPIGCNMSFRRSIFDDVGYFRSDIGRLGKVLLDGEEPEFSIRVLRENPEAKIINEPSAIVHHKVSSNRMTFYYLWKRSFYQGFSKAMIKESALKGSRSLSVERHYLSYLLTVSLKSRIKQLYRLKNLFQLAMLFISSFMVFLGFVTGEVLEAVAD